VKRLVHYALILAALAAIAGGAYGTYAWFTAQRTLSLGSISTGTLDLVLEPVPSAPGGPPWKWGQGQSIPPGPPSPSPDVLMPGGTITFLLCARSTGSLPLNYTVSPVVRGRLGEGSTPCKVTAIRIDGALAAGDALSAAGGADAEDQIEIDVTMPWEASSEYQGQSGELVVTVDAVQQAG